MAISITKDKFRENFPLIFKDLAFDEISNAIGAIDEIPENIWKALMYISEIYISADSNTCVLADSLREKAIYLTLAVYLLKTVSNFLLRRNPSQMTWAKEGEVSLNYQDIPATNIKDWFLTDPSVQPFGTLLWQILQLAQPCFPVNVSYPAPYYNTYNKGGY